MIAIGFKVQETTEEEEYLVEFESLEPTLNPNDLLVEVQGVSLNPVDVKARQNPIIDPEDEYKILGYDASGVVLEVGEAVELFAVGDEVYYAGDITRDGSNAQRHVVDERIVGKKPAELDFPSASGFPLVSITAWEILFDNLKLQEGDGEGQALLIIGAAGGVGSILIQLAKKLTKLTVIATASREESVAWVTQMGADHVISHGEPLAEQLNEIECVPHYIVGLNSSSEYFEQFIDIIAVRGHICLIDSLESLDPNTLKPKALTLSFEYMFARPQLQTPDLMKQGEILNTVSSLIDAGDIQSIVTRNLGPMTVEAIVAAHEEIKEGAFIGKTVFEAIEEPVEEIPEPPLKFHQKIKSLIKLPKLPKLPSFKKEKPVEEEPSEEE